LQRGRDRFTDWFFMSLQAPTTDKGQDKLSFFAGGCLFLVYATSALPAIASGLGAAHLAIALGLGIALVVLSAIDVATLRLPNALTLPLALVGLLKTLVFDPGHLLQSGVGVIVGYGGIALISWGYRYIRGRDGIGLGDAKLLAAAGAWVGVEALPTVLLIASLSATVFASILKLRGMTLTSETRVAFGPFLALSFWLVWLYGTSQG
jgi:leader peptidase (prepilin peptidase)/N-methyltransferase